MRRTFLRQRRAAASILASGLLAACSGGAGGPGAAEAVDRAAENPPDAVPALNGQRAPSQNFDLGHWKLTLPSGSEVKTDQLNSGYTLSDVFFTDPATGAMVFRCPNIAGTTANSNYSRTELREMRAPSGSASADANNWTPEQGGTLDATLRVDAVSTTGETRKRGRVIIGQIHGPSTTEVIRLYYHKTPDEAGGRIYAGLESIDGDNSLSPDIVGNASGPGIALGETFRYQLRLRGLTLRVEVVTPDGDSHVYVRSIDPGYAGRNLYFKAGVYNQNNSGDAGDYAQASFFALTATHP